MKRYKKLSAIAGSFFVLEERDLGNDDGYDFPMREGMGRDLSINIVKFKGI
ncbi:hypothetical protein [Poriferisphaera corsica]|nr:hypothetical protein [Poriferisphaera corsica]